MPAKIEIILHIFMYKRKISFYSNMEKEKVLRGPKSVFPKIKKSVGEFFFEQAETLKEKVFQIDADSGEKETYGHLKKRCTRVAIHLRQLGCKPNDVVMVCCENDMDDIVPVLATLLIGGRVSSIDPKETVQDIKHAISVVEPDFIFVEESSLGLIENSLKGSKYSPEIVVIGKSKIYTQMRDMETASLEESTFAPVRRNVTDTAVIVFSSGTTSLPKGISISHFGMLHGFLCLAYEMDNCNPSVIIHFASLFWISAIMLTGIVIVTGGTKVIAPNLSADHLLQVVEKYRVTFIFMSNTYTYDITKLGREAIQKYDLSSLYSIIIGGSAMNQHQLVKFRKTLPNTKITVGYGSSETAAVSAFDLKDENAYHKKLLSSGKIVSDVEVKIVEIESRELLGANQLGEILVKSPYLMTGYHNLSKPDTFDNEGFLKTGDIGYYDDDEYLFITERIHEVFKYKTSQISPAAIEKVLLEHPAVEEAVVFGVPHEIDRFHPAACVVLKKGIPNPPSDTELLNFVLERVSDKNKLRAGLKIMDHIPKTPTGKLQRRTVREEYIKTILD